MTHTCRLCSSDNTLAFDVMDHKQKSKFSLSVCKQCGLVQQTHIPSEKELDLYYSHNYRIDYKNTYTPKLKHIRRAGLVALNRIAFLMDSPINIKDYCKLIDIGAGGGEFVYLSKKNGFDAIGIEPNQGYSEFAKREYDVEIMTSMLEDLTKSSADIVTLFHVFEHMANPLLAMKKIADILKEDGLFFIEVPNILQDDASPHNKFFKAHLYYYSKHTLIACSSRYFDVVKVDDKGNLRILFKKKKQATETLNLPNNEQIDLIIKSIIANGWINYLFNGKGLLKPLVKINNFVIENQIGNINPKTLLDSLG